MRNTELQEVAPVELNLTRLAPPICAKCGKRCQHITVETQPVQKERFRPLAFVYRHRDGRICRVECKRS